jgi:hypothetical protein
LDDDVFARRKLYLVDQFLLYYVANTMIRARNMAPTAKPETILKQAKGLVSIHRAETHSGAPQVHIKALLHSPPLDFT